MLAPWLAHWLGLDSVSGYVYAWWSGAGSVLIPLAAQLAVVGLLWWWHHQCTVHRCYWPSRRRTAAGERACWRHHPEPRRTAGDVHAAHHAAKGRQ